MGKGMYTRAKVTKIVMQTACTSLWESANNRNGDQNVRNSKGSSMQLTSGIWRNTVTLHYPSLLERTTLKYVAVTSRVQCVE